MANKILTKIVAPILTVVALSGCKGLDNGGYLIGPETSAGWHDVYRGPGEDVQRGLDRLEELRAEDYAQ
tara:strand:+ start:311 stop:517 length:207 start_codon:yes stop_codon:yes gene_type:complete